MNDLLGRMYQHRRVSGQMLSVLSRYTDSDHPIGIFKLFLCRVSMLSLVFMISAEILVLF